MPSHIKSNGNTHIDVPDLGEDGAMVYLHLPDGELVSLMFRASDGCLDVCMYEPSDDPVASRNHPVEGYRSKPCVVTNWADSYNADGSYESSMHDAPKVDGVGAHVRLACQLAISVARTN